MKVQTTIALDLGDGFYDYDVSCIIRVEERNGERMAYADSEPRVLIGDVWHDLQVDPLQYEAVMWALSEEACDLVDG